MPIAQKDADKVVFRRFQVEGVEFFQIGPHGKYQFNLQAPVAQKSADEVVFRRFQVEGVEFF